MMKTPGTDGCITPLEPKHKLNASDLSGKFSHLKVNNSAILQPVFVTESCCVHFINCVGNFHKLSQLHLRTNDNNFRSCFYPQHLYAIASSVCLYKTLRYYYQTVRHIAEIRLPLGSSTSVVLSQPNAVTKLRQRNNLRKLQIQSPE